VLQGLLRARQLVIEDIDTARLALGAYAAGTAGFSDYLILERSRAAGCESLATFDRELLTRPDTVEP